MLHRAGSLIWIESSGGPLLLVPGEYLAFWEGIEPPSGGRQVEARFRWDDTHAPATDYDRACDIAGYVGLLDIGEGRGLVLGDAPYPTAWQASAATDDENTITGGILVRWVFANSEGDVIEALKHVPEALWMDEGLVFTVGREPLYLIDSTVDTKTLQDYDYLTIHLPAGDYALATAEYEPDSHTSVILHRLKHMGRGGKSERP